MVTRKCNKDGCVKFVFNAKSEGSVGKVALLLFALSVDGHLNETVFQRG